MGVFETLGKVFLFSLTVARYVFSRPFRFWQVVKEVEFAGARTVPIILLTGFFTGIVFTIHSIRGFRLFRAELLVGPSIALALTRELASVFTALMVAGRVGSAYCSQIGTMKVTEQLDALYVMGLSPVKYVVVPKVLALALSMPLLYFVFLGVGLAGGAIAGAVWGISPELFFADVPRWVKVKDVLVGMLKSSVFGVQIAIFSAFFGTEVKGSAEEVGKNTTRAIVWSSVFVFFSDWILTSIFYPVG